MATAAAGAGAILEKSPEKKLGGVSQRMNHQKFDLET